MLALISVTGVVVWLLSIVVWGGIGVLSLEFAGRSAALNAALLGYPTFGLSIALFGSAGATAYILRNARERRFSRGEVVSITFSICISAACTSLEGDRRYLLPAVLVPVGALVIARRGRIGGAVAAALVAGLLVTMDIAGRAKCRGTHARPRCGVGDGDIP